MNELTLPQPAADLWAAARDVLHQVEPHADYEAPIPPHLGGGTILAARWHHRASTDVDVIFPRRGSLTDLLQDDARNIVDRLGGKPRKLMGQRHVTVIFPAGSIDITAIDPRPDIGHKETLVDGRAELVLNNTQILRGKLERTQEMMARDLFDIATAAREDPAALASALNMLPEDRATAITWSWHEGREDVRAAYVKDERLWISSRHRIEPDELVDRAADAIQNHRYRRLQIDVDGEHISITKTIRTGPLPPETYPRTDPAGAIIESGLAAHLHENGPVHPAQMANAIEMSNYRNATMTIFDSTGAGLVWPERPSHDAMAHYQRQRQRDRDPKL